MGLDRNSSALMPIVGSVQYLRMSSAPPGIPRKTYGTLTPTCTPPNLESGFDAANVFAAVPAARVIFPRSRLVMSILIPRYTFSSQPRRNTGLTYLFASALFVNLRFLLSHCSFP